MKTNMLPAGRYWGEITGQGLGETSTGKVQLVISFKLLGAANPNNLGEYLEDDRISGLERRMWRVFTDKTIPYIIEDLKTLGFKGDKYGQLDPKDPRFFSLVGKRIMFYCQHGVNNRTNEPREEWGLARSSPLVKEEAPIDKVRQLDAMFSAELAYLKSDQPFMASAKAPDKKSGKKSAVTAGGGSLEITDEDVPF